MKIFMQNRASVLERTPSDLPVNKLRRDVISIAWPALAELILVQLCLMVDTMMLGRYGSDGWAVAAVGYCSQPIFLMQSVFIAMNTGATALIARAYGKDDQRQANMTMRHAVFFTLFLSIIFSFLGYILARPMVLMMGAETERSILASTKYLQIQMMFFSVNAFTMSTTACLRGIGKTRVSLIYNLTANLVNIVFNWLFIYGNLGFPELGVAGASIATVIGQAVAAFIAFWVMTKKGGYLRLRPHFKFQKEIMRPLIAIGFPAMIEQFILRFGMIIYVITITSLGESFFTVHQIVNSIYVFSFVNGQAFGIAATSLLGQSLGKKRPDHAKAYTLHCRRLALSIALILSIVFLTCGKYLIYLYNDDPFIVSEGAKILRFAAFLQPFMTSQVVISGALRGAGDTKSVAIFSFVGILLIRPAVSLVLVQYVGLGLIGAWIAMSIDQLFRSVMTLLRLNSGKWESISLN